MTYATVLNTENCDAERNISGNSVIIYGSLLEFQTIGLQKVKTTVFWSAAIANNFKFSIEPRVLSFVAVLFDALRHQFQPKGPPDSPDPLHEHTSF